MDGMRIEKLRGLGKNTWLIRFTTKWHTLEFGYLWSLIDAKKHPWISGWKNLRPYNETIREAR